MDFDINVFEAYDITKMNAHPEKIKLSYSQYPYLYVGTTKALGDEIELPSTGELFVTPFFRIAQIFAVTRGIKTPKGNYNKGYEEWKLPIGELKKPEPFDTIHMICEGINGTPFSTIGEGYIYYINNNKQIADHLYRHKWMDPEREALIRDVNPIPIDHYDSIKTTVEVSFDPKARRHE